MTATSELPKKPAEVNAVPEISTLSLGARQRALGRMARVKLHREPDGASEKDLAGDLFHNMFQNEPQERPDIPVERDTNKALMDWMRETHGWEQARANTVGSLAASMMASGLMWSNLTSDETMKEALDKQQKAEDAAKDAKAKQSAADAMMDAATQMEKAGNHADAGQMRADAQKAATDASTARQQAQALAAEAQQMIDGEREKPLAQAKMAKATKDAAEKAKDIAETAAGWGMGPGSIINTDPQAALTFLENNKGKTAQIAKLAGRMRGFALQARRERNPRGMIPTKVGMTQDIRHVFTTEIAFLRPDAPATMRAQKVAQFVDVGLLGYVPTGDAEKEGPFVAAVDVSPSMRSPASREIVAKAVALGVAQVAKMDGREYYLFCFASDPRHIRMVHSGQGWKEHLAWASNSQKGGTDFDMAIGKAMELLAGLRRSDCLFISDGEAGISDSTIRKWHSFQEDTGARMFYVPVGRGGYIDIEDLSDRVYHLGDLDEQTGADLAGQLGSWV